MRENLFDLGLGKKFLDKTRNHKKEEKKKNI